MIQSEYSAHSEHSGHSAARADSRRPVVAAILSIVAGAALLATTACDGDSGGAGPGAASDVPAAAISGRVLENGQAEIRVAVPSRHHAYLDAGEHGNLIPIDFDWQELNPAPTAVSAPAGVRDDEVKAQVLRGQGVFVFAAASDDAPDFAGRSLRVRSQICDEDKGICYRPTWTDVTL